MSIRMTATLICDRCKAETTLEMTGGEFNQLMTSRYMSGVRGFVLWGILLSPLFQERGWTSLPSSLPTKADGEEYGTYCPECLGKIAGSVRSATPEESTRPRVRVRQEYDHAHPHPPITREVINPERPSNPN